MKTLWNDKLGARSRAPRCWVVPMDGTIHPFTSKGVDGVFSVDVVSTEQYGKWSATTYQIIHAATTAVVTWMSDWETGNGLPQLTWEDGYLWLASRAPMASRDSFEALVREIAPKTAARWDAARAAEREFGFAPTPEELVLIAAAIERVAAAKVKREREVEEGFANSPFAKLADLRR